MHVPVAPSSLTWTGPTRAHATSDSSVFLHFAQSYSMMADFVFEAVRHLHFHVALLVTQWQLWPLLPKGENFKLHSLGRRVIKLHGLKIFP